MDSALQSAIGLIADINQIPDKPSVPFNLKSLRILSVCTQEVYAWVRHPPGSKPEDRIIKLDIDLCDNKGNVCVQMREFSSRMVTTATSTDESHDRTVGTIFATPVWEPSTITKLSETEQLEYAEQHIILCEIHQAIAKQFGTLIPHSQCLPLEAGLDKNIAERYNEYALACFERIQKILTSKPQGKILVQIVIANNTEERLFAGLSGLLKTAALENPLINGQIILIDPKTTIDELADQLKYDQKRPQDTIINYFQGRRHILSWQEVEANPDKPKLAFNDQGVYLITGGLGGLGVLFSKEILNQTTKAKIILTGRSELTADKKAILELLQDQSRVDYRQLDITDLEQVKQLITSIKKEYNQLNGIIHSAGMISDNFILKKTSEEFKHVLAPKVFGTFNLDQASKDIDLDFIVLFSSGVSVTGNNGQADYATANGFMDQFASYRNLLVDAGQRMGKTSSINWPFWLEGGIKMDQASMVIMQQHTGMQPMLTSTGIEAFHQNLQFPHGQTLIVEGYLSQLRSRLITDQRINEEHSELDHHSVEEIAAEMNPDSFAEKTQEYLRKQFSVLFKLPFHKIDPQAPLEKYGINSIMAINLTNQLEKTFGSLSKTLFFEYQTISELTEYFIKSYRNELATLFAKEEDNRQVKPMVTKPSSPSEQTGKTAAITRRRFSRQGYDTADLKIPSAQITNSIHPDPIAIIGLSGRYPEAEDIQEYWQNLRNGKDCIVEVPKDRWDWRDYYTEDRSKSGDHYSKWGGFINGVDEFDPRFFNISPLEAELMDPQERLFLQHVWMAVEDAGYTRAGLQISHEKDQAGQVGVYVGVMYSEYQMFGAQASVQGKRMGVGGIYASIANRVSYTLNLHGPSMTLDTMCSSSLTAIHLACQDLKQGRTSLAIAGGVNISIHPNKYIVLSTGQFISSEGHCQSFGEGGDGYIPGEGVGVVILKRLSEAKRDGNHIYGIIKGSALNHGGKTNGYTVPNPKAQASVISRALAESNIDARKISYIEAHGTGTKLGDPIEIAALSKAFDQYTQDSGFCLIGSVKSNIGHCESAAGIAGLTKVLLQMKYQQIVPSLHSAHLNPNIDFQKTPFIVNQTLRKWEQPVIDGILQPRIAGISSFGAGGSNAHIVVEQYISTTEANQPIAFTEPNAQVIITLSARTLDQLKQKARDLVDFIYKSQIREQDDTSQRSIDITAIAYTLQVGREAMDVRLGFIVNSIDQLVGKLQAYINGEENIEDAYQGQVDHDKNTLSLFNGDGDLQQTIEKWIAQKKLSKLLDLWVRGLVVDWNKLYGDIKPNYISLPAYPFAKEKYWMDFADKKHAVTSKTTTALHPFLHVNTSDLIQQRYSSTFSGEEFFLTDHQVSMNGSPIQKVFPAVAYLEMVRASVEQAIPTQEDSTILELHNTVWAQPIVVSEEKQVKLTLFPKDNDVLDYEIYSEKDEQRIVHCQGQAVLSYQPATAKLDIEHLKGQMGEGILQATELYPIFSEMGINYGQAYRGIVSVYKGEKQVLAHMRLPTVAEASQDDYVLHPCLMDSALQASVGLISDLDKNLKQLSLPFALESIRILSACTSEMFAWVRYAQRSHSEDTIAKLDIDLCDQQGNVCVEMRGFASRVINSDGLTAKVQGKKMGTLIVTPVWKPDTITPSLKANRSNFIQHYIFLYGMPQVATNQLEAIIHNSHCSQFYQVQSKNIAERYSEAALICFEYVQTILNDKSGGKVLVQIVIANNQEEALLTGVSGLLKSAALENPHLTGQVILTKAQITTEELARQLQENQTRPQDTLIKYEQGLRYILNWKETKTNQEKSKLTFKDQGVYLITGGLGGLGFIFAREIFKQTKDATVIVTGRSTLTEKVQAVLSKVPVGTGLLVYKQLDIVNLDQVKQLITSLIEEHKQINGIIHSAGMAIDNFILKKTSSEFSDVLAPKVTGTFNLDEATKDINLDFLVLFSSVVGAMGNLGQADYAAANGFLDQFSTYRNQLADKKFRRGQTLSINWPLWQDGGMHIDQANKDMLQEAIGIKPMQTATGIEAFYQSLTLHCDQSLVMEGDLTKLRRVLLAAQAIEADVSMVMPIVVPDAVDKIDPNSLIDKSKDFLRKQFSELLKLSYQEIDLKAPLENYGIDSILAMRLTNKLEETFGSLSKTLFFEYQTITALAGFFAKTFPQIVQEKLGDKPIAFKTKEPNQSTIIKQPLASTISAKNRFFNKGKSNVQADVAIVGLSGKYPQAENLEEFWENLKNGKDCITEIPKERWDSKLYFDPHRNQVGKSYSKWGGFIADVDKFDPLFFNISPKEAELIDPQERLFIETVWHTIEDAGYSKESISATGKVGVFVGVMYGQYQLYGAEAMLAGNANVSGSSFASIANRVSYFFDFHGPSIALDTMCSSSLTAIHLACEEIRKGDIDAAIAGGVNVSIHPHKYLILSQGNFASSDGKCRSFGEGGDGYVAGEGVGAVLLKSLEKAIQDGDHIYGVIKSSVINHGGKTNGYTVPNPNAQGDLILETFKKANIDPASISYIETHGTGTSLGDPIEITGLKKAFEGFTQKKQFCPIGSVKSNIGHLEAAAGIASVTKVLLQMKHGQLVPSLHADPLNPNIDFNDSPFFVQKEFAKWERTDGYPRRVGISSFGAGGSNAHLIVEEYPELENESRQGMTEAFVLSAKDLESLSRYAETFVDFIEKNPAISLMNLAYTSQLGRTSMNERLVIVATSLEELKEKLIQWLASHNGNGSQLTSADIFYGSSKSSRSNATDILEGEAGMAFFRVILETRDLVKLAKLWITGVEFDWSLLYKHFNPRRISIPTYPFKKERYWIKVPKFDPAVGQQSVVEIHTEAKQEAAEKIERVHFHPKWKEASLTAPTEGQSVSGSILVWDTTGELCQALKNQLEESLQGNFLIWLKPHHSYQEIAPTIFTINPEKEEHFYQLIENLKAKGQLPCQIIHRGLVAESLEKKEQVVQHLNHGLYALFYLCKALMKQNQTSLQILSFFVSNASVTTPLNEALSGFFKTLTLENPKYMAKVMEIQNDLENPKISISETARFILNEFRDKNWNKNEIRYKFKKEGQTYLRYVRELTQYTPAENKMTELPLKQGGVYIISGALGGLGFIFSEYLIKKFQCKLVLFGRSALNAKDEAKLSQLQAHNTEILYLQADASKLEDMEAVVRRAKAQFSQINGVIHCAGVNRDSFILHKSKDVMEKVLEPKIYGAINLDQATLGENLDLFILFSSIAGVMGNLGQCDYSYGNRFIDSFAESRENLRSEQKRFGKTLSINWPYWEEGGMMLSQDEITLIKKQTGICPLPTKDGIQYWEEFLQSRLTQGVALYGIRSQIEAYVTQASVMIDKIKPEVTSTIDAVILQEKTESYLKALIGDEIKLSAEKIDARERFESFGIDSIVVSRINASLEKDLGDLPKTLFYQYETIEDLAEYLAQEARQALIRLFNLKDSISELEIHTIKAENDSEKNQEETQIPKRYEDSEPMAIIGVHGYYPQSEDLNKYWENLKQGKDLVDLVPASRWNYEEFYDQDPEKAAEGKIYCKWGGFLNDVDKFDPLFFNIPPEEARIMDPQERLFLESVSAAIEDAGYTKDSLKRRYPRAKSADVGVFVGVTTNSYNLLAAEEWSRGNKTTPSALPWSIANRVSYFFDFQGPSMPIDTACSSSLVAIHLACESLKKQECQVAIAGGVNLYLHPSKYHSFCKKRMVSLDGKCSSYGAGDDGFVPGEGVGTIVLKTLSKAIEDRDYIYAVIPGSAFAHSGRSNGYSAPNPNSQADLISQTLSKANINPETIGYVEGHGTGTQLGDSLEIVALTNAFQKQTKKKQFCSVGSVKANMGHSESAAGIAGVTKILLQLKHRQLVPTIHSKEVNPNIKFEDSPFYLQHALTPWESSLNHPRRALMNSFGAGGVNACIILEEYEKPKVIEESKEAGPYLVILSAKNEDRLREYVNRLLTFIGREKNVNLANLSYTLQVGREVMQERLAIVVSDRLELIDRLKDWKQQKTSANIFQGHHAPHQGGKKSVNKEEQQHLLRTIFEQRDLARLAQIWIAGSEVDWEKLYPQNKSLRIALPTYPFARERYWVSNVLIPEKKTISGQTNGLHPLISYNASTLKEVCFNSLLSDREFYSQEHQVNEENIFPGCGFLEIACISGNIAGEEKVCKIKDIVWMHPLSFRKGSQMVQTFLKPNGNSTAYQITSLDDENERMIHSEGRLIFQNGRNHSEVVEKSIPIKALKEKCSKPREGVYYYDLFRKTGFNYGPAFQTIQELYINNSYALSKLKIANHLKDGFDQFILHPSLLDGALQTVAGLIGSVESDTPHLPFAIDEIEILRPIPQTCYVHAEFTDSERRMTGVKKFNIQLLNEEGDILVKIKNFYARAFDKVQPN